ncbi:hypothetical protein LB503_012020 [Fusarium chuoi]|nr:hypothetical protein LB503_012020 [Fusarium chuoi]
MYFRRYRGWCNLQRSRRSPGHSRLALAIHRRRRTHCVLRFRAIFLLPDYPRNARYFSPDQRRLAQVRILVDRQVSVGSTTRRMTSCQAFKAVVTDGKIWFFLIAYSIIILGMSISLTLFRPF